MIDAGKVVEVFTREQKHAAFEWLRRGCNKRQLEDAIKSARRFLDLAEKAIS